MNNGRTPRGRSALLPVAPQAGSAPPRVGITSQLNGAAAPPERGLESLLAGSADGTSADVVTRTSVASLGRGSALG